MELRTSRRGLILLATLGVLLGGGATAAHAQASAQAESEFRAGKAKMKSGLVAEACEHFEASQRLEPDLATLMSLADCREKNGQFASAWGAWVRVVSETRYDGAAKAQHGIASKRAAALEPRLSYLTINVPDESRIEGLEIARNGTTVDRALWNRSVPVDGGDHVISGKAPGHEAWSTTVTLAPEHDRQAVEVPKFKELPELATQPTTIRETVIVDEPSIVTPRRKVAIGVAAGGVVVLGVGALLGFQAQTMRDDAEQTCPADSCTPDEATEANDLNDRAQTRALGANVAFGVGAAAVATAAVLWYLGAPDGGEPEDDEVSITPSFQLGGHGGVGVVAAGRF